MKPTLPILAIIALTSSVATAQMTIVGWDITSGSPTPSDFTATTITPYVETDSSLNTFTRSSELDEQVLNSVYSSTNWNTTDTFDPDSYYIGFSTTASDDY
ncbi:MAG: hypothetical protein ACQKBU_12260, partial [Verrucomicrobiales bacterium]